MILGCLILLPWLAIGQMMPPHSGQYASSMSGDSFQQHQQQIYSPHQQPQQPQQMYPQQPQQQPLYPQQQQQQQPSLPQQPVYAQQQQQQQQLYYQGNMGGSPMNGHPIMPPSSSGMQSSFGNQYPSSGNDYPGAAAAAVPAPVAPIRPPPSERYLAGNLSQPFSFQVAQPSVKVTYIGLNGHSLYIMGVGFSNRSKFNYDEQNNLLTILSLDHTTVGYYTAVDKNWQNIVTIVTAINGEFISESMMESIRLLNDICLIQ
jgi:hypothetical protein